MILYHIGKRKPAPKIFSNFKGFGGHPNLEGKNGLFLTPEWKPVFRYFGEEQKKKRLYIFKVPMSVIKFCGGLKKYDRATEIFIFEECWDKVVFLGSKELPRKVFTKDKMDTIHHQMHTKRVIQQLDKEVQQIVNLRQISREQAYVYLNVGYNKYLKDFLCNGY